MGFTWFRKLFQGNPGSSHFGGSPFFFFRGTPPGNHPANRTLQVAFDYVLRNGEGEHKLQAPEHATRDVVFVFGTGAGEPRDKRELRWSFVFKLFLRLKQILLTDILDMFEGFKEIWANPNEIAGLV